MLVSIVTRFGRYTLRQIIHLAYSEFGMIIIYGDTDSIFVIGAPNMNTNTCAPIPGASNPNTFDESAIDQFKDKCTLQIGIEIELDKKYDKLVISGKKNYAGITNGKFKISGFSGKKSSVWMGSKLLYQHV